MPSKILWLASYPKSGNTWMRVFLSAYRNHGYAEINKTGPFSYDDMSKYTYQVVSPKPYTEMKPQEMAAVRGAYLVHMTNLGQGDRLFLKTHSCIGHLADFPAIPEILTEGAIYLMRDPRDVCVSYAHHCQMSIDETIEFMTKEGATINHDTRYHALGTWSQHVISWVDPEVGFPRHFVRYEDMKKHTLKTFKNTVEFLGWEYDEDIMKKTLEAVKFSNLRKQEDKDGFREQSYSGAKFFRKGEVGSWKEELTNEQAQRIVDAFGDTMEKLGYKT